MEEIRWFRRLFDKISWAGVFTGFFVILSIFTLLKKTQFDSAALFFIGPLVGGFISGYRGIDEYIEGAINGFLVSFLLLILVLLGLIFIFITDGPFSASASVKIVFTLILILAVGLSGGLSGVFIKKVGTGIHSSENTKIGKGYLVCDKCGGYYKLQLWESPDDFDKCHCGGNLEYHENDDELEIYEDNDELEMIRDSGNNPK